MSMEPCLNPNCKSYGKPHPNCRCYGSFAEGGDVAFCSKGQPHDKTCEYFAEGGLSGQEVPEENLVPESGQEVPEENLVPTAHSPLSGQEVPEENLVQETKPISGQEVPEDAVAAPNEWTPPHPDAKPLSKEAFENANSVVKHNLGSMQGLGETATGLAKAAGWATALTPLGEGASVTANILQNMISSDLIAGGDEAEKWLLGKGDPNDAAGAALSHMGIATGLGALFGAGGAYAQKGLSKGLSKLAASNLGERLEYAAYGFAAAARNAPPLEAGLAANAEKGYKLGQSIYSALSSKLLPPTLGAGAEATSGFHENGIEGALKGAARGALHGIEATLLGFGLRKAAAPVILKVLSSGVPHGIAETLDHAANVSAGSHLIDQSIGNLIKTAPSATDQIVRSYGSKEARDKLDNVIKQGGILTGIEKNSCEQNEEQTQPFAHGGEVMPQQQTAGGVSSHYPEQAAIIANAKGRISNYLNSLRPTEHTPRLAFDDEPDQTDKKRSYHKALDIAVTPLGVMEEIRKGTIDPEHLQHFNAMHPELSGLLQRKMTEKMVEMQSKKEKPPYTVRQSLSLFMGTPLSGEMTPTNIQAAQSVFLAAASQQQPSPQSGAPKKSTSKLTKSDQSFLTGDQALERRQQKV